MVEEGVVVVGVGFVVVVVGVALELPVLELWLAVSHFCAPGFDFWYSATALATWPSSLRFSQKMIWSRLITMLSVGPCNSQPSFTSEISLEFDELLLWFGCTCWLTRK